MDVPESQRITAVAQQLWSDPETKIEGYQKPIPAQYRVFILKDLKTGHEFLYYNETMTLIPPKDTSRG